MTTRGYDYVVVGAGSAGCLVANRLSADPSCRVLLLEAGGSDRNLWIRLPVGYFRTIYDNRFARLFETEPGEGTGGRAIVWPRGRVIGGSSSINGLIFIRGQHEDFDDWARLGAEGWSFREVLPFFKRYERHSGPESQWHGALGEFETSELRNRNPACDAWLEAAQQTGLPFNPDFNAETTHGVGRYQLGIGRRWRTSSAGAFLHPVLASRPNLTIVSGAQATRILFAGRRATGVEYLRDGRIETVEADREVVLCAGALQSPQLLQLSGIGPAALLAEHGIPVIHDAPEVGRNLQDHYQARAIVRLTKKLSLNDEVRNPLALARMGLDWLVGGSGPLTVGAGQVGGAACTEHAVDGRPDVQFNVMPLSVDKPGTPLHRYSGFTASVWQCHPRSRGTVAIRSADPLDQPRIVPNYFAEEIDRATIVAGIRMLRDIFRQPAFRGLWDKEVLPGEDAQDDAALWAFARDHGGTVFHACGTCRMGGEEAVLDPQMRVRGVERLRVVDASAMPTITSANTNAASLMIGEKGAHHILEGG
ncbi:GMC family oxidoreductase [Enterovirga rhinocerotis]|uniref:Choline dehydrogenase n=1 Tax=Enterovirga rhinocerotis TaxID=1339210 RepID=A0A4R7BTT5_9HYPH|nr:GMC family oxidoreductase N-terminal domain-containing protein [Enterovirga rhinocerotis]TDR89168.1 choline dehydrogenase [Enterovirga rhinocerotis]